MPADQTILVRVAGLDRPGITTELLTVLSGAGAELQDMEQITVRRQLNLSLVVTVPAGRDLLKELLLFGWERDLGVDFEVVDPTPTPHPERCAVTVLGSALLPADLAEVTAEIAAAGGNIDRITRLSRYPVWSYEFVVEGADVNKLQEAMVNVAAARRVDIAVQPHGLGRRAQRLVVLDVDSTLIRDEVIDLLADEVGVGDVVAELTERAMRGELDFESSLVERVRALAGATRDDIGRALDRLTLTPGARTFVRTLRRLGYRVAIISGGFTPFTDHLAELLNLDHAYANELEWRDDRLTGELAGPVVDRARKAELLADIARTEGVPLDQVVAVGDGANDLDMLQVAGLGIAFNAKPVVRDAADTNLTVPYLDAILFMLGITREEIEAADAGGDLVASDNM